jgi:hypothetical protein
MVMDVLAANDFAITKVSGPASARTRRTPDG